jgi:hypothetical protein
MHDLSTNHTMSQPLADATDSAVATTSTTSTAQVRVGRLVFGGACALGIGSFLPWATVNAAFLGTYSVSGLRGGGLVTLAIAGIVAYVARHATTEPLTRRQCNAVLTGAGVAALIVVLNFGGIVDVASKSDGFVRVTPGFGLFLAGAADLAVIIGSTRMRRSTQPNGGSR